MTNRTKKIWIIAAIITALIIAQEARSKSMPDNMIMNPDEHLLTLSKQAHEGLYDLTKLKTIYLEFSQSNWWTLLTNNYKSKTDIPCTLTYEGVTYPNTGIRFRGNTSYQNVQGQKKSFNISLDYTDEEQDIEGYQTLNLNNAYEDQSMMREVVYNALIGQNIPSLRANFVKLVINGENWGVYNNVQQINKDYYEEWFMNNDGTSWRAEQTSSSGAGGGPGGGQGGGFGAGYCSLNYLGDDTSKYTSYYQLKSSSVEHPWASLPIACKKLNQLASNLMYDSLKNYIDVDRSLWYIASENMFTDDDGYVNKGGMDYFVYYDTETGRICPIEFDGNSTFETKNATWSPFLKETESNYPLISKLLANASLKQRYVAHIRTMINSLLDVNTTSTMINTFKTLIADEVAIDTKKLYTVAQFNSGVTSLISFITTRKTSLLGNAMISAKAPSISTVQFITSKGVFEQPTPNEEVKIQATVNCSDGINQVLLYYGTGLYGVFDYMQMFDDGQHNDGASGDGVYGATIPGYATGTYIRYYIEARSANSYNTASFMPEGAEHDVYYYQVQPIVESNSNLVINEVMAANTSTLQDPQGDYDDWVELFNKGTVDVDLTGMYLSDKIDNPTKWQFPDNTSLKAGEYMIVWTDEDSKDTPNGIHTNFKLSADGESVILVDKDANGNAILDSVNFGSQTDDISYGRYPNGTGSFITMSPTPLAMNYSTHSAVDESINISNFSVNNIYPNPSDGNISFSISINEDAVYLIDIIDIYGRSIKTIGENYLSSGSHNFTWNGISESGLSVASGTYIIRVYAHNNISTKPFVVVND